MVTSNSNTKKSDAVSIVVLRKKLPEEPNDWTRPISHQNVRRRSRRRQKIGKHTLPEPCQKYNINHQEHGQRTPTFSRR